jgi:hypothetical protein
MCVPVLSTLTVCLSTILHNQHLIVEVFFHCAVIEEIYAIDSCTIQSP